MEGEPDSLRRLALDLRGAGLEFLLIGGHAVAAYGFLRSTLDIDLLVAGDQPERWRAFFLDRGYRVFHESANFLQLTAPAGLPPVDLIYVAAEIWQKLRAAAVEKELFGLSWPVAAPLHLIALKLHAAKQWPGRAGRDHQDIRELIQSCGIDVQSEAFRTIMGTNPPDDSSPRETLLPDGGKLIDYGDLVLPVPPPGMLLRPHHTGDPAAFAHFQEEYLREMLSRPGFEDWRRAHPPSSEPFVL